MPTETQDRVYKLLQHLPHDGLAAAKQLFWTELNYDRANTTLSRRGWPDRTSDALHGEPVLLAQHRSQFGSFDVIYVCLSPEYEGRDFPLSLTAERLAITQLLNDHPYALFVFSDPEEEHWHLVNVRYDRETSHRRIFRRIAIGPYERLRTAAERVAMLDLATLSPDLFGLSPIAIQQRHDEAFDVEAVTREFFGRFARLFYRIRGEVATLSDLADDADEHTQMLLDRLLFLYFVQKKGWLAQDPDYLYNHFLDGHVDQPDSTSFYGQVIYPLFLALSDRQNNRDLTDTLGAVPFLNGGLFELSLTSSGRSAAQARLPVTNATFRALFTELLEHYNFTISEDSPLDQEVAIDPEMLGKIFESLVLEREQDPEVDLRKATGSYYTPRPVVAFMCREALAEHLTGESAVSSERILRLLELPPAAQLSDEERTWLRDAFSRDEAQSLKSLLLDIRACDPAVGSGAFLMGLLQAITWAVGLLDWRLQGDDILARRNYTFDLKKQVIEHCLYGVDIQAQAVQICELRLWLSLIVDYELPEDLTFDRAVRQVPALPNLAYKVRQGDSLLERLFGEVVALDEMGRDRRTQEIVEDLQKEKAAYFSLADTPEKRRRELRILELQTALAGNLVEVKRGEALGYQPGLFGEETAAERRQREAWEERDRRYQQLKERVEQVRRRLRDLRRDGDGGGVSIDDLRRQLLGDAGHPTFLWRVDFAEVFSERDGFDVIVGNPPYLFGEYLAHLSDAERKRFSLATGQFDAYWLFYEKDLKSILRQGGVHSFITADALLARDESGLVRTFILESSQIIAISHVGQVFQGIGVSAVVLILKKTDDKRRDYNVQIVPYNRARGVFEQPNQLPIRAILADPRKRFLLHVHQDLEFFERLSRYERLRTRIGISRGEELGKKHLLRIASTMQCGEGKVPILAGEGVARYVPSRPTHCVSKGKVRKPQFYYSAPKVVVVKTGRSFVASVDYSGILTLQSVYNIHAVGVPSLSCEYLCLLLNSRFMNFLLWHQVTAYKKLFPQINQSHIQDLPFAIPSTDQLAKAKELFSRLESDPHNQELLESADTLILDVYECSRSERIRVMTWTV